MPAPQNLSFETTGVGGLPDAWLLGQQQTPEAFGDFADGPFEGFDRGWLTNEDDATAFELADLTAGEFTSLSVVDVFAESFGELWGGNQDDLITLEGPEAATFLGPRIGTYPDPNVLPATIPDNTPAGITRNVTVGSDPGGVARIAVYLEIRHTYRGDLLITLTDPAAAGTTGNVWANDGGGADDLIGEFDVTADFPSPTIAGVWALKIVDTAAVDEGQLDAYELRFYGAAATVETFDANWQANETVGVLFDDLDALIGQFNNDSDGVEAFVSWYGSENDATSFDAVASTAASFATTGAYDTAEKFVDVAAPIPFAVTLPATIYAQAHGLADGAPIFFRRDGVALPTGLNETDLFIVDNATANTFTVQNLAADPITFGTRGEGVNVILRPPAEWWVTLLTL